MVPARTSKKPPSGSPATGEPEYLLVGTLRRPHGVHGELLMEVVTDFPDRLQPNVQVYVGKRHLPQVIARRRAHHDGLLLMLRGIETPEAAAAYRNQPVFVTTADRPPPPEGHFYHHQLVGCKVVNERGQPIGTLTEILQTGANDVYVVQATEGREVLLPAVASVVMEIDVVQRLISVRIPDGLVDELAA